MSWLKRRDAEQQSRVIRNLTEHNKQLWADLVVANEDRAHLRALLRRRAEQLRERGVIVRDVH